MKNLLMLVVVVLLTSCGIDHNVEFNRVRFDNVVVDVPEIKFGPDFTAWYDYCRGKVEHKNKKRGWDLTEEEILFKTEDCYYSLDVDLPDLPDFEDII